MITLEEAKELAEKLLDAQVRPWVDQEIAIDASATAHVASHWVFFYNTRAYYETKSAVHALAGNGPVLVSAEDGGARLASSAMPWQEQI